MKVVLFDRDGTLIVDPPDLRVNSEEDIKLFQDTIEALKILAENNFAVVMITNQAGIAEGLIDMAEFERLNQIVIEQINKSGIKVLQTFVCPHSPDDICECRKPKPKMLYDALQSFGLDASQTFFVGDRSSDILAGKSAGCKTILVKTANENQEAPEADFVSENLLDAVNIIASNS